MRAAEAEPAEASLCFRLLAEKVGSPCRPRVAEAVMLGIFGHLLSPIATVPAVAAVVVR
jgi:hypothetical protein